MSASFINHQANHLSGRVMRLDGNYAWVEIGTVSACGTCEEQGACDSGLLGSSLLPYRYHRLFNKIGAKAGDVVTVSVPDGGVLAAALLAYVMPLLLGIAGAAIGMRLGMHDRHAVLGLLAGLGIGWLALHFLTRNREPPALIALQSPVACNTIHLHKRLHEEY